MFIQNSNNTYLVVLEPGEKIIETLTSVATDYDIKGGMIVGIGAIKNVELGFYHLDKQDYTRKLFDQGEFELISMDGNISLKEEKPFVHIHAAMGTEDFSVFGGHLFEAEVAVTAEVYITPFGLMPERDLNQQTGLHTICKISH